MKFQVGDIVITKDNIIGFCTPRKIISIGIAHQRYQYPAQSKVSDGRNIWQYSDEEYCYLVTDLIDKTSGYWGEKWIDENHILDIHLMRDSVLIEIGI